MNITFHFGIATTLSHVSKTFVTTNNTPRPLSLGVSATQAIGR